MAWHDWGFHLWADPHPHNYSGLTLMLHQSPQLNLPDCVAACELEDLGKILVRTLLEIVTANKSTSKHRRNGVCIWVSH